MESSHGKPLLEDKRKAMYRFMDEREMHLSTRWFHYSPPETFSRMFRSPDWALWRNSEFEAAIESMRGLQQGREADRTQIWAANGVQVVRLQVVDAESIKEPEPAELPPDLSRTRSDPHHRVPHPAHHASGAR
jgi:hypothetical protein